MSPEVSNPYHDKYLSRLIKNLSSHLPIYVLTHTSTTNSVPSPCSGLQNKHSRVVRAGLSWDGTISVASGIRDLIGPLFHFSAHLSPQFKDLLCLLFSLQDKCQILTGPAQSAVPSLLLKLSRPFGFICMTHRPLVGSSTMHPLYDLPAPSCKIRPEM